MKTFILFLKNYLWGAVYLLLCALCFAAVFYLCHLPTAPVLYALGLCAFWGAVFLTVQFVRFQQKHRLLSALTAEITDSIDHLPPAEGPIDTDYQTLVKTLFAAKGSLSASAAARYQDLLEYYTLWVHQIKTPIAAMQLILQAEETPEYLELRSELFKIQQYVEMVLSYLRLDSSSSDFVFRACELDKPIRAAVHTYAGQFVRKKVELRYTPLHKTVLTDEKWLQFVIEQLLSNALKYAPGGTVTITIERETLFIRDNGIGIAEEDLPRIFSKGFTGLNGRGTQRSTGIGLYLCRQVMERLGHGISITSRLGQGTTVRLDLSRKDLQFD